MPENNNNDQPLDFAEKVLQSLKRQSRAVDLTASSVNKDFTAYGSQEAGDPGPGSGGNKDIVIIPGFGGAAASSTSQVNFYWNAPAIPDSTGIDNNVRATIYNYAISATRPTLVIGGYDGTNQYKPIANYGTGTGITAKIWFHPFLGRIDADQFGFNTLASTGVSTVTGVLTWDTTQNKIRVGVAGTAKTLAYTDDISPFSGSATTASNLNLATSAAATNHFITMSASQTATGVAGAAISTVSTVFVVPNTGVVNASGFSGNVTGNVSGNVTGNVSGNLTGNVSGNVTGNVSGNLTGNVTGIASTANSVAQLLTAQSGDHFITFSPSGVTAVGAGVSVATAFKFIPSTGVVTASGFSGNVTGTVSGNVTGNVSGNLTGNVSGNLTGNVSGNVTGGVSGNVTGNVTGTVSGNVTGNVSGNVTGNVSGNLTGNVTGIASTANSVAQLLTAQSGDHFITFSPSGVTAVGAGVSVATAFKFIPSTGVVTASGFSGNVTGTVSGNVTGNVSGSVTGNVSGNLTGNVSGNVTGGVSGNVTGNITGTVSGNVTGNVSGNLTGNVSGNVTGNVSGNLTGNVTGIASTANSVAQLLTAQTGDHFITFSPSGVTAVGAGVSVATAFKFVPSTGVVTASGFSGNVTGTVSGNVTGNVSGNLTGNVSGNLTGNVSGNVTGGVSGNVTGNVTGTVSGNVTGNVSGSVTGNVSGNLTGNVSGNVTGNVSGNLTGNVSGIATTAQNINVLAADAATGNHFLPFVRTQTGSGLALSTDNTLYYDPAGNILYSTNFNGSFTGTISGVASTAANVVVNNAAESTNHFVLFSPSQTGAGVAVSSDSTFTINPSTNAMSMGSGSMTANSVTVGSAARTVSTSTGNLILDSSGGQVDITDNVVITGNLTVQGTTITVDSTVSTIVDPVIVVGSGVGGSHSTADNNQDRGIEFRWSTGAGNATTGFFGFSDTDGKFRFIPNATTVAGSNVYTGTVGTIVSNLEGTVSGNVTGNVSGNLTGSVSGNVTGNVSGNLTGNVTGIASTANSVAQLLTSQSGDHFITFSPSGVTAVGAGVSVATAFKFVPSTGVVTASGFSGNVTGTVSGNVTGNVSGNLTGNVSGNLTGNVSGNVTGGVSGNVTGNVTGTVSGNVTGNVSGNLTGNVSGNVTGNVSGNLTGNVTGIASTANSVAQLLTAQTGDHFITFSPSGVTAVGTGVSVATALKFVPSTGVVSASGFSGNVTGTVSGNVTGSVSGSVTGNVSGNITGNVSGNVTGGVSGNVTGNVTGTVSGNVTGNVSGNLTGNVSGNVTGNVSGNLTGNVTGIASTANSVAQILTAQTGDHFVAFSPSGVTAVGVGVSVATAFKFIPSTGVVTATGFSGNVTGTVSGNVTGNVSGNLTGNVSGNLTGNVSGNVTGGVSGNVTGNVTGTVSGNVTGNVSGNVTGNVSGNLTGNVTGIASTANSVAQLLTAQTGDHFITFSPSGVTAVGTGVSVATALKFIPSTGVVTATGFSGNVTGTVSGNVTGSVSGSVTGNVSGNLTGNVSGNVTGGVSGNVTGNVTGTVSGNVTGNVSGNLTGNVSGNVTGNVSGNLTGNVSGTATTAQHIHLASTLATTNYILLSSLATGSGIAISTDTNLAYNASTDTLTLNNIVGSGAGLTLTATSALTNNSYLTIQTISGDDNSTSDFFIRGINSSATSKFSVDANGNLRATTKSFDIPHPTKEGKRLVYGVLEGPEHGVYHRGTVEGKGNILIELPEYWTQLVNDSYSIQLTPWGNYGVQILEKTPNSFIISATGNPFTKKFKLIKVDYIVHGSRKDAHLDIEQD